MIDNLKKTILKRPENITEIIEGERRMKKFLKGLVLIPMWLPIWYQLGLDLDYNKCVDACCDDPNCGGCCRRAKKMVDWWRA